MMPEFRSSERTARVLHFLIFSLPLSQLQTESLPLYPLILCAFFLLTAPPHTSRLDGTASLFACTYLCVLTHVCIPCVQTCTCVWEYVYRVQKSVLNWVSFLLTLLISVFFETVALNEPRAYKYDYTRWLASHRNNSVSVCPVLWLQVYTATLNLLHGSCGYKHKSSCLGIKCFYQMNHFHNLTKEL